ncbi:unnamed protein product [Bursaphelenchus okinawaensis]|uniref:Uncharacterized protein n=1 Tax=Bursaphelenchus okinawaensis TaxID=465554 RepID=A0A811JVK5_9BILA|nr:unnamed protein product [Bursaphelenchus okinawaensis]CAG9085109.1 unnamed protein product [Bursaphelenchus okinawaensis]
MSLHKVREATVEELMAERESEEFKAAEKAVIDLIGEGRVKLLRKLCEEAVELSQHTDRNGILKDGVLEEFNKKMDEHKLTECEVACVTYYINDGIQRTLAELKKMDGHSQRAKDSTNPPGEARMEALIENEEHVGERESDDSGCCDSEPSTSGEVLYN